MAYTSGFFDAVDQGGGDYDRVYSAATFAHYFSLLVQNGVFPDPSTGMQVKASSNPDMHVSVQPGSGWVNGYYITVEDNAPEQLTIPIANPSLSRIDSVIMGLNYVDREIQLYIKSGAVSASPSAVSLQRDNDLYELELAQITIGAGVASISQTNITDMRQNTSRCGIVAGTIDQIDTTDLFAQYNSAFQAWFDDLKAQLGDNVATNLQNQINTLKTEKVNVSDKASTEQAITGTDDTKWVTPKKVANEIENLSYLRNKILSDTTATLYGLGKGAVPDDVLRILSRFNGGLGNEYMWAKERWNWKVVKSNLTDSWTLVQDGNISRTYVRYSDDIILDNDGNISLAEPITQIYPTYNSAGSLQLDNKYVQLSKSSYAEAAASPVWFSDGVTFNGVNTYSLTYRTVDASHERTLMGYVNSPSPDAYPPAVSDGYTYALLGQLGERVRIATGTYTGTGTYGSSNPNSLTFGFEPKLVIVSATSLTIGYGSTITRSNWKLWIGQPNAYVGYANGNVEDTYIVKGNKFSWYNSSYHGSADMQLNDSGQTYYYIAIG